MESERLPICSTYESNCSMSRFDSSTGSSGSASITTSKASAATDCLQAGMAEPHEEALAPQARFKRFDFVAVTSVFLLVDLFGHTNPNGLFKTALFIC